MKNRNKTSLEKPEIDYSSWFIELGALTLFTRKVLNQFFKPPFEHGELIKQGYYIGYKTLPLISITGFIMGLVLTIQIRPILVDFGATSLLPGLIAVAFVREVGPVITGLLCSGKISSGIAAEIGAMKVSEQIDAMEVSGTKPLGFVVATRVLATTLLVPLLVIVGDAFSFLGSIVALNMDENVTFRAFMNSAFDTIHFSDLIPATIKTIFFGFFIGLIGSFKGYQASQSTEAVGLAANSAVITASLTIFVIDLLAVLVTNFIVSN